MRKTFKHLAMAALASALIAGQATTAFAFKNDTNNGPGSGKSTEVSLQAPGDNSDSSQSSGNNTSPTTIVEESSQSTDTSQSETSQTTETTTETTTDTTTAAETVTEDTSAQVPTNQAFLQVQLLRALQERKVKPIGSNQEIAINVRLVSATNENLRSAIDKGDFREDLYHRINEFTVRIPALKERKEDLLLFANNFLDQANIELQKDIIGFDNDVIRIFQSYSWPGNLRQMKNALKYATLLATGRYITPNELPEELTADPISAPVNIQLKNESHECEMIKRALQEAGNNKTRAAQLLGIDRKTLYNKLKAYGIA